MHYYAFCVNTMRLNVGKKVVGDQDQYHRQFLSRLSVQYLFKTGTF